LSLENPANDASESLRTLKQITDQLVVRTHSYRCQRCGFGARAHHWQCPSCKQWGTIKPLHSAAGD
jgi:lipopolysaccharide biosynthesis regulator YciM